jgi:hypothetical protein
MAVSYPAGRHDDQLVISIVLTPLETEKISHDAKTCAELVDSLLWALGLFRTGGINSRDPGLPAPVRGDWLRLITDLARLQHRVGGALAGAIRAYAAAEGDLEKLGWALKADASAASRRLAEIIDEPPGVWEQWATAVAPTPPPF